MAAEPTMFLILSIIILGAFLYYRLRYPYVRLLNKIPGPYGIPLFGMFFVGQFTPRNQILQLFEYYFDKLGSVTRFWTGPIALILIGSPEEAQTILSPAIHIEKAFQMDFLKSWLRTGLLTSRGEKWRYRRRLLTPAFHITILEQFFDTIVRNSKLLVRELESKSNADKFDIVPYVTECSLHNICETAMGVKMNDEVHLKKEYVESVHIYSQAFYDRALNPFLYPDVLFRFSSTYRKQKVAAEKLHNMSMNIVKKRLAERKQLRTADGNKNISELKESTRRKEFLDILLDISEQDENAFTIEDVREEVDVFILGGYETISLALYFTIYLVGLHPHVQEKVHIEVDNVLGQEEAPLNMQMLQKLEYLECVIKESLRLYPPVPVILRTTGEDALLNGYQVPAGHIVSVNIHQIHRSRQHYHNAYEFDPSHFFPENARDRHPFAHLPFSGGARSCPGPKFAMMELKIVLATFFKHYTVTSLTKREDLKVIHDLVGRAENGVWIQIRKRMAQK